MKAASVTVVVPTFNRASTIEAALRQVFSGKPVPTGKRSWWMTVRWIAVRTGWRGCRREDSRIKLIRHGHNRGAQAARNTGIDAARTAWIAFLDSDDKWMPQSLALRLDAAEKNRLQVVHTGAYVIHENGERSLYGVPAMAGRIYTQLLQRPGPMFQGLLAAKEALTKIGALDENIVAMQEWDTAIRLAKHYPFGFLAEPTSTWDCRGADTITKNRRRDALGYEQVVRKHFFSMLRYAGPEALYRHYRTLSERYGEMDAKPDVFRSQTYARLWKLTRSVVHG